MEDEPLRRSGKAKPRGIRCGRARASSAAALVTAAAVVSTALAASPAGARPVSGPGTLQATVAQANALSNQIDQLGQQYDSLQIQLRQAQAQAAAAKLTAQRDQAALNKGRSSVAAIAANGYENGDIDSTVELLQSSDPQQFLNKAAIIQQLSHEQSGTLTQLSLAAAAANRARQTAAQQTARSKKLSAQMDAKVAQMQKKQTLLDSQAYAQALSAFQQTGSYPSITITSDTAGAQALKWALTQRGAPYVWGGAGPYSAGYDCSGLVLWAYAHEGISLDHFTGDQWNEGIHVSRNQLQPGDLVFLYGLDHVGMWIGNGLMVDAPTFGQPVQIQPVPWGSYDGAVHIA